MNTIFDMAKKSDTEGVTKSSLAMLTMKINKIKNFTKSISNQQNEEKLKKLMEKLNDEFSSIDKDGNASLSKEEVMNFFTDTNGQNDDMSNFKFYTFFNHFRIFLFSP